MLNILYSIFCPICAGTANSDLPIRFKYIFWQKIIGINRKVYWPVHFTSRVDGYKYILIGKGTAPGYMNGCYVFAKKDSPVIIGEHTIIASNVCIAGFSHDLYDYNKYPSKGGVQIGSYCWLGANSVILPGVELGNHTIVAAGAVITKSFSDGFCVLAGNPARKIKDVDKKLVIENRKTYSYYGYIKEEKFELFKQTKLDL